MWTRDICSLDGAETACRCFSYNNRLVPQTLLLAVLLASLTLVPAAVCLGLRVHDMIALLVNLRYHLLRCIQSKTTGTISWLTTVCDLHPVVQSQHS